jgi:2-methylisocitrate lyase-like PEP mutase family enzyme
MDNLRSSSRRTDEQLEAILDETAHWVVNGRQGQALCATGSLHQALDRANQYASSGAVVTAVCRLPGDNIIVFAEQMKRLRRTIIVRDMVRTVAA